MNMALPKIQIPGPTSVRYVPLPVIFLLSILQAHVRSQGAPEASDGIEGSFDRPKTIDISEASREYGPVAGIKPLRAAVARLYNEHHRKGKASQYSWENVAIVPGGRAGLIRIAAVLNNAYLGFFIPDYTAYNEMLSLFRNVSRPFLPQDIRP